MKVHRLDDMTRGWFVGDFEPTLYRTDAVEVAVKHYVAGDAEERHVHRIATELTAVVSGTVRMDGRDLDPGDIVTLEPGEPTDFLAVTDAVVVAVKLPAVAGDKHIVEDDC
jgi:mannose-6-phosphate isomerase-like protein (cupin superfamily)